MKDSDKTKEQLIQELKKLRRKISRAEKEEANRKKTEEILLLTQFSVDRAAEAVFWMGPDARFTYVNEAACQSMGYSREELLSMTIYDIDPELEPDAWDENWRELRKHGHFRIESRHRTRDGKLIPVEIMLNFVEFEGKEYNCAFVRDMTRREKLERKMQALAITDDLTGLLNRRGFFTLSEQQCKIADRKKRRMCLFYVDLDNMKTINDELGHKTGDQALVDSAAILRKTFRESDIIARIGGDEFAILITEPSGPDVEAVITNHINDNIRTYNMNSSRKFKLSFSLGAVFYFPESPCSIDGLLTQADIFMYEHKKQKLTPKEPELK
jgi:diguanylate cyclase (GGDEF)-like protein/PAS domain S-box-containing protein